MPDGRRNNGGNKNAGRKPKADEIKMIERMDAIMAPDSAWEALSDKVKEGDTNAIKAWLAYRYGQPKQTVDHTTKGETIKAPPIQWVSSEDEPK